MTRGDDRPRLGCHVLPVADTSYALDNHLHLVVQVLEDSEPISKFIGCIKAGFTRGPKRWYNRERISQLPDGQRRILKPTPSSSAACPGASGSQSRPARCSSTSACS